MSEYDNFLTEGDFNSESAMSTFCETYQLHVFVKSFTCFKKPEKLSCIDVTLKNFSKSCINKQTTESELLDFHKLMRLVLKMHYEKPSPKIVTYRHYKNVSNESSCLEFLNEIGRYLTRTNQKNFIDKELNQAVMVRFKLCNKFLKLKLACLCQTTQLLR